MNENTCTANISWKTQVNTCYLLFKSSCCTDKKFQICLSSRSKSNSNGIRTHNHLVRKGKLNYLAKMALYQIWRLLWARGSLTFRQTIECRFTLKLVRDMIITQSKTGSLKLLFMILVQISILFHFQFPILVLLEKFCILSIGYVSMWYHSRLKQ